jgi:hypothetical protein
MISPNENPPQAMLNATRDLYGWLNQVSSRHLAMSWHGQHWATACAGPQLNDWVRRGMPATGPGPAPPPIDPPPQPVSREVRNMVCLDEVTGGYWVTGGDGWVHAHRGAPFLGGTNRPDWNPGRRPAVGIAPRPNADGYVIVLDFGDVDQGQGRFRFYDLPRDGSGLR